MADLQQLYREQLKHFIGKGNATTSITSSYAEALVDDFYWLKPILRELNGDSLAPTKVYAQSALLAAPSNKDSNEETVVPTPPISDFDPEKAEQIQAEKIARESLFRELYSFAETHVQSTGQALNISGARLEIQSSEDGIIKYREVQTDSDKTATTFLTPGDELKFEQIHPNLNQCILVLGMEYDPKAQNFEGEEWTLLYRMLKATQISLKSFLILASARTEIGDSAGSVMAFLRAQALAVNAGAILAFGSKVCSSILGQNIKLGQSHGKFFEREVVNEDTGVKKSIKLMPIFHPEFLKVNPNMKKMAWEDLQVFVSEYTKGESFPRSLDS